MTSIPVTKARSQLYQLLDAAAGSHEPIQITGKRSNAVLVSEEDWRSIQETPLPDVDPWDTRIHSAGG